MKSDKKAPKRTLKQIEIDTNTDDLTIGELLNEEKDKNYKLPYSEKFIKEHNLATPVKSVK